MILRCTIDQLLVRAIRQPLSSKIIAFDSGESFEMERIEAIHYELVAASRDDVLWLEKVGYRLLRRAADFRYIKRSPSQKRR